MRLPLLCLLYSHCSLLLRLFVSYLHCYILACVAGVAAEAKRDLGEEAAVQIPGMVKRQSERGKDTDRRTGSGVMMAERKTDIVTVTGAEIGKGKGREIERERGIEMVARTGSGIEIEREVKIERETGTEYLEDQPGKSSSGCRFFITLSGCLQILICALIFKDG